MMKDYYNEVFYGERPIFNESNIRLNHVEIRDGESSLKKISNAIIGDTLLDGKYPIWHATNVLVKDSTFTKEARAALWYSSKLTLDNTKVKSPKMFRESTDITIFNSTMDTEETLWDCNNIYIKDTEYVGEYILFHSNNIVIDNLTLKGKYSFQHTKNVEINNSYLNSKDLFWNSNNVTVKDTVLEGKYLGWYSNNLTLINCTIIGTQPLCYAKNLTMIQCKMIDTDRAFEESTLDVEIITEIDSVVNPGEGIIKSKGIQEYINTVDSTVVISTY